MNTLFPHITEHGKWIVSVLVWIAVCVTWFELLDYRSRRKSPRIETTASRFRRMVYAPTQQEAFVGSPTATSQTPVNHKQKRTESD